MNEFSYYRITDDPTGSGRGKLYMGVVNGGPPPVNPGTDDGRRHRPYPDLGYPYIEGPFASGMDLWIDTSEILGAEPGETGTWFSPLGFGDTGEQGANGLPPFHFAVGTHLGIDDRVDDQQFRLVVLINPDDDYDLDWRGTPSPIPFPLRTWVRVRLEVNSDRSVRLYQDGMLVSEHRLGPKTRLGTVWGHWGLYGGRDIRDLTVLNDNITLEVYGKPGLGFRYEQTFGETEVPYFDDAYHLNGPVGLGTDGTNIWIAECEGHRALKYASDGSFEMKIGKAGLPFTTAAKLWCLQDVAVDGSGNIWVVKADHNVIKFNSSGSRVSELGVAWNPGTDNDSFNLPRSIAFDNASNIYISDSNNHRIQVFNSDGIYSTTIGVTGITGSDNAHFNSPRRIAVDSNNRLYVADANNHRVQIFDVSNVSTITYVATIGASGESGSDNAHLNSPHGIAVDVTGEKIYVADTSNGRVQVFDYTTRGYLRTLTGFYITDIAVDSAGNLYVADPWNFLVQQFDSNLNYVRTYGTPGVPYLTDGYHYNWPSGVAAAPDGGIYIGEEAGQRVIKLNSAGVVQWTKGEPGIGGGDNEHFNSVEDVTLDAIGRVYVADSDNCRIQIYNSDSSYDGTLGTGCGVGDYQFNNPYGIAIGPDNTICVADTDNHRVQVYNGSRVYVATLGETGVAGSDNAHFNSPRDVEVDSAGNIYVVDQNNHRIQIFNNSLVYVHTIGETGVVWDDNDHLNRPTAVVVGLDGRVFVADYWGVRVQVFDSSGAFLTTIRGRGGNRTGQLRRVEGLAVDTAGNLYVAEAEYHRIQKFAPMPTETPTPTSMPTPTPTSTPTPTETPVPQIIFQDNFENGLIVTGSPEHWNYRSSAKVTL